MKDYIAEEISWLDDIITNKNNSELFEDENLSIIQKELSNRWINENRLELLKDLVDKHGEEKLFPVIDEIIFSNCIKNWKEESKGKDNSFDSFYKILWAPLKSVGFEFSHKKNDNTTQFHVTKCPMYDLAKKISAEKFLFHLVCLTDEPSVVGFNNKIEFKRSKTLMEGFAECDHCYIENS